MKKLISTILLVILLLTLVGCQNSKSDDISQKYFNKAKNFVKTTQEILDGDIEYEEAKEKLDSISDDFMYDKPGDCDETTMVIVSGAMVIINTNLRKVDNEDEDAIETIKGQIKTIEDQIYK